MIDLRLAALAGEARLAEAGEGGAGGHADALDCLRENAGRAGAVVRLLLAVAAGRAWCGAVAAEAARRIQTGGVVEAGSGLRGALVHILGACLGVCPAWITLKVFFF